MSQFRNEAMSILVPGRGLVNVEAEAVNRAVKEYDERLRFGFNEQNGDWVVYIRMPREFDSTYVIDGEPCYPVLGFQDTVPSPDEAVGRLSQADTMRHGFGILDRINKENAKIQHSLERQAQDMRDAAAERIEFETRKQGLRPQDRVFFKGE